MTSRISIPTWGFGMTSYFISHAALDAEAGALIQTTISDLDQADPEVFLSTRAGDIPGGEPWLDEIKKRLDRAEIVFLLLTPVSVRRWWIWFEAGAAWLRADKTLIPVLAGGLSPTEVPEPLRLLQLYSLEEPSQAVAAFDRANLHLASPSLFSSAIVAATAGARSADLLSEGWDSIEVGGETYVWGGSVDGFRKAPRIPTPADLTEALKAEGIRTQYGLEFDLSNEEGQGLAQVFQLSGGNILRSFLHGGQVLLAMRREKGP